MRRGLSLVCMASLVVVFASRISLAQQGPPRPENLKVLPRDIPRDTLLAIMRGFTVALGVRCDYCHVSQPGPDGRPRLIPAKDDKETKIKARFMLRMVDSLDHAVLPNLPDRRKPPVEVRCMTCHRGLAVPATLATVLTAAVDSFGVDSAVARYTKLREDMESGHYDLSEGSVSDVARVIAQRGRPADAIALLQMNERVHPNSPAIDVEMADLYRETGDKDKAITAYRTAITKGSRDPRVAQRLKELGVNP